ncbi:MAG TPA: DUF1697 domain-containing protein [Gemmatimonadaceae bacterium]|nr:DUF1697 domain-containing protein [Gemmatimonadaceae bacterium]
MTRYFCFLRAINVGGHTVTMQKLKQLFESMGFANVETFIASGNVIFESKLSPGAAEKLIFSSLNNALGYDVHAFLRTREELVAIDAFKPAPSEKLDSALAYHIGFAAELFDEESRKRIASLCSELDHLRGEGREIFWVIQTRMSDSKVTGAAIEKSAGGRATFRNINTVRRLLAKYPAPAKGRY